MYIVILFFFFQAEDAIRDHCVTGVQTCALPIFQLMKRSTIVLTDSGGIQEEAPGLSVPVLVMRETTERPEGVDAGVVKLVGTSKERIAAEATRLLTDPSAHAAMAGGANPYGDGHASERIVQALLQSSASPVRDGRL